MNSLKNVTFGVSLLIVIGFITFLQANNKPLVGMADAACVIHAPVQACVPFTDICTPGCLIDTGNIGDAAGIAKKLAGKSASEIGDALGKISLSGGNACAILVNMSPGAIGVDQMKQLITQYGCTNLPDSWPDILKDRDCSSYTSSGRDSCQNTSKGKCFWYSGGASATPTCVKNTGNMNDGAVCRDGGHCYTGESCSGNNYCVPDTGGGSNPIPPSGKTNCNDYSDKRGQYWYEGSCQPSCDKSKDETLLSPSSYSCDYTGISSACCAVRLPDGATPPPTTTTPPPASSNSCEKDDNRPINASLANQTFHCKADGCSSTETEFTTAQGNFYACSGGARCCANTAQYKSLYGNLQGNGGGSTTPTKPTNDHKEAGYCGDSKPTVSTLQPVPYNGEICPSTSTLTWRKGSTSTGEDPYCSGTYGSQQTYFYACPATSGSSPSTSPTPTPTPFNPIVQGGICNPTQGPWQCASPNVCLAIPGEGRCCPANSEWKNNKCVALESPAPTSVPSVSPTPIATNSTCNDYIPASNIHQVCRIGKNSCLSGETTNGDGSSACSNFYNSDYTCCQLPQGAGPAGSSCNLPTRACNPSQNTSTGTNDACSGCGGFCVGSGSTGSCQNPYAP